jgi:hypothetical protein
MGIDLLSLQRFTRGAVLIFLLVAGCGHRDAGGPAPGPLAAEMTAMAARVRADFPGGARLLVLVEQGITGTPDSPDAMRLELLRAALPPDRYPMVLAGPNASVVHSADQLMQAVAQGWPPELVRDWAKAHPADAVVSLLRLAGPPPDGIPYYGRAVVEPERMRP